MRVVEFLAGSSGRWAKAVAGLLLIILGAILGGGGRAVAVIGLASLTAGAFTFGQHRPRVRSERDTGSPERGVAAMNTLGARTPPKTVGGTRGRRRAVMAAVVAAMTVAPLMLAVTSPAAADTPTAQVPVGTSPQAVAVNPVTNKTYVTNNVSNTVTVLTEQAVNTVPLQVAIAPLPGNSTSSNTPTFALTATTTFTPPAPAIQGVAYQVDTWQGPWGAATATGGGTFTATTPTLQPGVHILYAYATDAQASTTGSQSSPLIGNITAYLFLVTPAPTTVRAPAAPVFTADTPPASAVAGTPYTYTFAATGYPAPRLAVISGALPAGLTLNPTTGVMAGTPTTTGPSTFTVTATNGVNPHAVTDPITVTVTPAPAAPVFTADTPPTSAVAGTPYTYAFAATGYPAPRFAVTGGALPAGLTLTAAGVLAGTPTTPTGVSTFTVTATNGVNPHAVTGPLTVTVAPAPVAPVFAAATPPAAVAGTPYTYTFTATGYPTPTIAVTGGALPAGLVLDSSTAVVSGTPTSAGSATFTLTATNAAGTDSKAYTIVTTAAAITKTAAAAPILAFTGFDVLPWGVGGILTLLVGVMLLVLEAKYPRSHAA